MRQITNQAVIILNRTFYRIETSKCRFKPSAVFGQIILNFKKLHSVFRPPRDETLDALHSDSDSDIESDVSSDDNNVVSVASEQQRRTVTSSRDSSVLSADDAGSRLQSEDDQQNRLSGNNPYRVSSLSSQQQQRKVAK